MRDGPAVVVLRALGLGDLCCAVPALRAVRCAHPEHRVVLAAPRWQEPLALLSGVDEVVDTAALAPLAHSLTGADVAVNLHGRGPESTRLLAGTAPQRLVAFDHHALERHPDRSAPWRPGEHEVRRWCRLLDAASIPTDPTDLLLPRPSPEAAPAAGAAVVHPGAGSRSRQWPPERFAQVVRALVEAGFRVALTGSEPERLLCEHVAAQSGVAERVTVLAGHTDLSALSATVAHAPLVVANDTGVAHLATAHATPSVVLFGPTSPAEWGPIVGERHRALWAGRRGDPHGDSLDPGLAQIGVADVLAAVEEVSPRVLV